MHGLIICRDMNSGTPEGQQLHGFVMYREALKEKLGFTFDLVRAMTLDEIGRAIHEHSADMVALMMPWTEPIENLTAFMRQRYETKPRPRLVLIDYSAQSASGFFDLLPYVDRFVKRQVLRDRSVYQQPLVKNFVVTDFLSKRMNFELDDWVCGHAIPDPGYMDRVVDAWNLGVTPTYRKLLALTRHTRSLWRFRPYSINRRLGFSKDGNSDSWYHQYRRLSLDVLVPLEKSYRCTGFERVSSKRYTAEMLLSKIVFSPFGWGELCFRDYQAVANGALLVKPSMSHLKTSPDIFIDYETYVPVEWDNSDLVEKCEYYLKNPRESMRIIRNAQEVLYDYFENDGFVKDVQRCFEISTTDTSINGVSPTIPAPYVAH